MRFKAAFFAFILAAVTAAVSCGGADHPSVGDSWTVGFGESAVFLDLSDRSAGEYYIAGFRSDNPATGILDDQTVRALWLDDNTGRGGILFIVADCVGLSSADCGRIKEAVKPVIRLSGRICRDIFVISTHDHAGIDTLGMWGEVGICGKNAVFMDEMRTAAVSAVSNAMLTPYADTGEAEITYYSAPHTVLRDSRPPEYTDENLHVIEIRRDDTKDIIVYNIGVHAESLGGDNSLVSADFPAYIAERQNILYGNAFLFIPGTLGGLITPERKIDDPIKNASLTAEYYDGGGMGAINYQYGRLTVSPSIELMSADITVPLDNPVFAVLKTLGVIDHKTVPCGSSTGLGIRTRVTLLRLGGVLDIMLVPGELTPELAYSLDPDVTALDTLVPEGHELLIFSLADDEIGYILPEKGFMTDEELPYLAEYVDETGEKHYEETNSAGPKTFEVIFDAFSSLYRKMDG